MTLLQIGDGQIVAGWLSMEDLERAAHGIQTLFKGYPDATEV